MKPSIEQVYEKGKGEKNEDELLIQDNLYAVFDGATSLDGFTNDKGETGAKIAAKIAKKTFSKNKGPLTELAREANHKIRQAMEERGIDVQDKEKLWATTASVVRLKENEAEFFNITDSFILVVLDNGSYKLPGRPHNHDLKTLKKWKELVEKGETNIREKVMPLIKKVRKQANEDYGFLNGKEQAEEFFHSGRFELENVKSIVLGTDGLLIPKKDPNKSEKWDKLIELYQETGLQGIKKQVREIENSDPECKKYIRTKKHDDMAGIAIEFE